MATPNHEHRPNGGAAAHASRTCAVARSGCAWHLVASRWVPWPRPGSTRTRHVCLGRWSDTGCRMPRRHTHRSERSQQHQCNSRCERRDGTAASTCLAVGATASAHVALESRAARPRHRSQGMRPTSSMQVRRSEQRASPGGYAYIYVMLFDARAERARPSSTSHRAAHPACRRCRCRAHHRCPRLGAGSK